MSEYRIHAARTGDGTHRHESMRCAYCDARIPDQQRTGRVYCDADCRDRMAYACWRRDNDPGAYPCTMSGEGCI